MKKVFIFDLDDTLYWNRHDYCYPILEFEKFLLDKLGHRAPHVDIIHRLFSEIDKRQVHEINPLTGLPYGYSMERFPTSMVVCYKEICRREGLTFDPKIAKKVEAIGYKAFSKELYRKKGLVKGAAETLDYLKDQRDYLILLTKGDRGIQERKISILNLRNWFDEVIIKSVKTVETFKELGVRICDKLERSAIWSVGNSFVSDIKPALEAGFRGIYIPYETWEVEEEKKMVLENLDKNLVLVFNEIIEIKKNYKRLS